MSDRDRAVWECEELRAATLKADLQLRETASRAEAEAAQRVELERQVRRRASASL